MGYFPPLAGASSRRNYSFGGYQLVFYDDIPSVGRAINYNFVLAVFGPGESEPLFCIASECSESIPAGHAVLGTFDGTGHSNHGIATEWTDPDRFCEKALELAKAHLRLPAEVRAEAVSSSDRNRALAGEAVRTPEAVLGASGLSREDFDLMYRSYQFSLSMSGKPRNWNDDIEGHARNIRALRETEILLAKTDLHQAILNRIIVRLVTEGRMKQADESPPPAPPSPPKKKPWWKFW